MSDRATRVRVGGPLGPYSDGVPHGVGRAGIRAQFRGGSASGDGAPEPTIGFSRRCCSPTSWTRRVGPRRSATVTGMRCLMRTTPSSRRSSPAFAAAR
jgi:hypothetical protein